MIIGLASDTLISLKKQVKECQKIPVCQQKYSVLRAQKKIELTENRKRLADYGIQPGDEMLLDTSWYCIQIDKSAVQLSMPKSCLEVFERVLDFMYSYQCDESCFQTLGQLSPSSALGALWLAENLDIPDLEDHLISYLERVVTPQTAHTFLAVSVDLGQENVLDVLTQQASKSLESIPVEVCDGLPLDIVEGLLDGSCNSKAGCRLITSYLRARDSEGMLDEPLYRRLMLIMDKDQAFSGCDGKSTEGSAGREKDQHLNFISAEDAVALLGLARRFGDAEIEGRCLRLMTRALSGLGVEDMARLPVRVVQDVLGDDKLKVSKICRKICTHLFIIAL